MLTGPLATLEGFDPTATGGFGATGWVPYERRWDGEGEMPRRSVFAGPSYPCLAEIHPRRWAEVLSPLDAQLRQIAAHGQGMHVEEMGAARALVAELPPPAQTIAREAARTARLGPAPDAPVPRTSTRQVNVRLGAAEYADLMTAAEMAGTSPTTLARWFILGGARRAITDHAAAYSSARSRS
jgi:hypothetical protein